MKVLIINTSERTGGAAVAASRLAEALTNNGVSARMLVMHKQTKAHSTTQAGGWLQNQWNFVWERVVIWLCNGLSRSNLWKVSIANTGQDITRLPEFQEADVVHLHWINQGMLSLGSIGKVLQSGKPVVWTMHDMWEATAICHHSYGCERFATECGHCWLLRFPRNNDLSRRTFQRKQRMWDSAAPGCLHFVAVSEWLAQRSRQSALIGRFPITVIPNAISLSQFKIIDRTDARTTLHVTEPYIVAFGAARIDDPIKGFDYLVGALQRLVDSGRFGKDQIRLLLFGTVRQPELLGQLPVAYTHMGYIDDEHQLSLIYSAANVTVSSSLYETFGQTLIEAQACGSVPVSFEGSGQADIIDHKVSGYLAERLSAESLADGIAWGLLADIPAQQLRRSVARRYSESIVAHRYIQLYNSLAGGQA